MATYKLYGDVQGLQQNPSGGTNTDVRDISFLLSNYKCEPPRDGLPKLLVVRMTIARPAPDFDGMAAEIEGSFGDPDGSVAATAVYVAQINYRVTALYTGPLVISALLLFGLLFVCVGIWTIISYSGRDGPWPVGLGFVLAGVGVIIFALWQMQRGAGKWKSRVLITSIVLAFIVAIAVGVMLRIVHRDPPTPPRAECPDISGTWICTGSCIGARFYPTSSGFNLLQDGHVLQVDHWQDAANFDDQCHFVVVPRTDGGGNFWSAKAPVTNNRGELVFSDPIGSAIGQGDMVWKRQ